MSDYSFLDQLLHRVALQSPAVAEMSFDFDQKMVPNDPEEIVGERHVFVSGLARAGTTVLMRNFYATGEFRSLTYRDMPFVLAPNLWRKMSQSSKKDVEKAERAHGDRILVDVDSPESLDEVFWRIFAGGQYIHKDHLTPHAPDAETRRNFVRYVNAILAAQDERAPRYLSKNNNNVLRLGGIRQAFPQALILVPFRDPTTHAGSLQRMHRNFVEQQAEEKFVKSYMTWLVHHEFGHDHRPFRFGGDAPATTAGLESIDYWLALWCATYGWLENSVPDDIVFVCYEDLCTDPGVWTRLAGMAGVSAERDGDDTFSLSQAKVDGEADPALLENAASIYGRLMARSRAS
jgi:hypothetical protein